MTLQFIYLLYHPKGAMQLYQFILIFASVPLILAQMPSFHSLRHINLISLILCLAYAACATAGAIYIGEHKITSWQPKKFLCTSWVLCIVFFFFSPTGLSKNAPARAYSIKGSQLNRVFGAFNGISIISTTYASGIIPEIQVFPSLP